MEPPVRPDADGIYPVYTPGRNQAALSRPDQEVFQMKLWLLAILTAALALAASVDGKWKASFTTPNGQTRESVFDLKSDGEKLTGTVSGGRGETAIENGVTKGDDLSFTVKRNFGDRDVVIKYNGKVVGDAIEFKVSFGEDRTFEMKAVKQ